MLSTGRQRQMPKIKGLSYVFFFKQIPFSFGCHGKKCSSQNYFLENIVQTNAINIVVNCIQFDLVFKKMLFKETDDDA